MVPGVLLPPVKRPSEEMQAAAEQGQVGQGGSHAQPMASRQSGVQSLTRAFELLESLATAGGEASLTELASASGLPASTIHRIMATLAERGYVHRRPSRRYLLGPSLIPLGETAGRMLGSWAHSALAVLAKQTGETANMAILDNDSVVYVAQAASGQGMRIFTEVGKRFLPHSTGVGKALLAQLGDDDVLALLDRTGTPSRTPNTITDPRAFIDELHATRERGYALDNAEQELGVCCIAAAVKGAPTMAAVSVSGPMSRLTDAVISDLAPAVLSAAERIAEAFANSAARVDPS